MKQFLVGVTVMLFLVACGDSSESKKLSVYYSLDSLLDGQIILLQQNQAELEKQVMMDGQSEAQLERPDSAGWEEEFIILRDFDINKSYYVGAYEKEKTKTLIRYDLSDQIDAPVKFFEIELANGIPVKITGNYFEDKSIYQHRRFMEMNFKDNLLTSYSISGFQKLVLKDTISYNISGKISLQ